MFLEKRVYQGSSGRVYPLPFIDRIAERPVDHAWKAVWLENEYVRVLVLPELGGRIHRILDLTNGYDLIGTLRRSVRLIARTTFSARAFLGRPNRHCGVTPASSRSSIWRATGRAGWASANRSSNPRAAAGRVDSNQDARARHRA